MTAYFVTGTDTGVGKTRTSCALIHALRRAGHARVVGMKPVAAGCEWVEGQGGQSGLSGHWLNEDVAALRAASSLQVPPAFDNPYALPDAVSPHIAARNDEAVIDLGHLEASFHALQAHADAVVVEGAGGFIVPLHDGPEGFVTSADLAARLRLPVVLTVGLRLGCLNHALLTQEAILSRGLTLAGWVANVIDPHMPEQAANLATLQNHLQAPMLAHWPFDAEAQADQLPLQLP
ncbi:dethiobiotin synthase [Aquabacterium lacunae]|uniref:ATP-dependent dethiobiotin synthetase BioD n=1 Tax=Aquabacterium lacunae TaxID=2528630 RepID=A0A4Q9H3J1_9BURK|nr:dethiobiotin synthase [Aquabacterium lacunae]TBO30264.1 dethiobiotin synthase [Aquabacterium lacunae]